MSIVDATRPDLAADRPRVEPRPVSIRDDGPGEGGSPLEGRSVVKLALGWLLVALISTVAVTYGLGGYLADRDQRLLLSDFRAELDQVANEASGLAGISEVLVAPERGDAVAIVEIPQLQVQQVVIEGVHPEQTQQGPGHVPGTAGLGQPGNAAVVGRHAMYGRPFENLDGLAKGDKIVATTRQGQSVYVVEQVREQTIIDDPVGPARSGPVAEELTPDQIASADSINTGDLYGPSEDDQLTLVTSDADNPFNSSQATIVIARLDGSPFEPTPQNGRTQSETGTTANLASWPALVLAVLAYLLTVFAAAALHRRARARVVYFVTAPPFIVFTVVVAQTASQLLPAWT